MKKLIVLISLSGLMFLLGCEKNRRPEILEINCSPESGYENTIFNLTGLCQDVDGDLLTYIWTSTTGEFISTDNDFEAKWLAPYVSIDTVITVKLSISDGYQIVSRIKSINVINREFEFSVSTEAISNITNTSATSGGIIAYDGEEPITSRGVCYSVDPNPTIENNKTINGSGPGSFVSNLEGLQPSATYYVKAYATNINGTTYGNEISFQTTNNETQITVTTSEITEITSSSAISGGRITVDGEITIIKRGVCWSINPSPTTSDFRTINESGPGSFTSILSDLEENTVYYVRAYAEYDQVIEYGDELNFKTLNNNQDPDGTFMDSRDGHIYNWKRIGDQVWMQENLAWLPEVKPPTAGSKYSPVYYVQGYYGRSVDEVKKLDNYKEYGALYNWPASLQACPEGWHLPSIDEWEILFDYLGGKDVASGKMKETGYRHWYEPNYGATNSSGFTALGGGDRSIWPDFYYRKETAFFWTSEAFDDSAGNSYSLNYEDEKVRPYPWNKAYGFSIRCLKND